MVGSAQQVCRVNTSGYDKLSLTYKVSPILDVDTVLLDDMVFNTVSINGFSMSSEIGCPSLPTLRGLIEIPLCDGITVTVTSENHQLIDGAQLGVVHPIAPVQPSICKTASRNPDRLAYRESVYSTDVFCGLEPVTVRTIGIARDRNLAQVLFSPVKYNPVTNQFLVYTEVEVTLSYDNPDLESTKGLKLLHHSPIYGVGIETINQLADTKDIVSNAPMRYLIVAHSSFRGHLDEFANRKRRTGFIVDIAYTDDAAVGLTQESISAYIKNQYLDASFDHPAPTYLLLVGDLAQIPASACMHGDDSHVSDLYYACWTDDDNIPDCYYGRFSAQTVEQLLPQLQKTLIYERYQFPDPTFLDKAILVAGVDGGNPGDLGYSHADPAMDYAAKLYVNGTYGYTSVLEYKNDTSINPWASNVSVFGNDDADIIRMNYSRGAGLINYSAHGGSDCWANPQLNNSQVAQMTNFKKCGIMIGNCCLSGKFDEDVCLGEALLRKDNFSGAVGYIGATSYTYWGEDFYWAVGARNNIYANMTHQYIYYKVGMYDLLFHTHGETMSKWATSLGSMTFSGNMAVEGTGSGLKEYYWQVYHTFGDPSLSPWLTQASEMPLAYSGAYNGSTSLTVSCAPYAYVALTDQDYNLIGAQYASGSGSATIQCAQPLDFSKEYTLAATCPNWQPRLVTLSPDNSVEKADLSASVSLYPNPATGQLFVSVPCKASSVLFSSSGSQVMATALDAGVNSIDVAHLPKGVYYIKIEYPGGTLVKSLVKL